MYELVVKRRFSAAHKVEGYPGNCSRLHGHNWTVVLRVVADSLDEIGMAFDFRELKKILDGIIAQLDHTYLNDNPILEGINPTAENLARKIFELVAGQLPEGVKVASVEVWESDNSGAKYFEPDIGAR